MLATASFPAAVRTASSPAVRPVVFLDDQPEPTLCVRRATWTAPLNEIAISLDVVGGQASAHRFAGRSAVVALPRLLRDGQTRWQVLAVGRLEQPSHADAATQHQHQLILLDRWSEALSLSPQTADSAATPLPNPTVGQTLQALADHHHLNLTKHTLPRQLRDAPLLRTLQLDAPLGSVLGPLLEDHQLFIQRRLILTPARVAEHFSIRPLEYGRRIQLPLPHPGERANPVTAFDAEAATHRAQLWTARGEPPQVESTFTLQPGWDPALEGQPDSDYDRSQSSDFSRFGNVYRRWVLNEDAALDALVFDLAAFFDQPALAPTPLPFGDCLTLDDAGRALPPVVEISTDAGVNWARLTEPMALMSDRAGITLESIALPSAVLAAAKASNLRLRVTARLTSPLPIAAQRWQGNPFANVGPEVTLDASDAFAVRRILPGSLHDAAIQAGQLTADLRDDTQALADWLLAQLDRDQRDAVNTSARARLTLSHARPEFRIGDRIDAVQPNGHDLTGQPTTLACQTASVSQVRCDFTEPAQTVLTLLA